MTKTNISEVQKVLQPLYHSNTYIPNGYNTKDNTKNYIRISLGINQPQLLSPMRKLRGEEYYYLPITKCASNSIGKLFATEIKGDPRKKFKSDTLTICVIREPKERWISGVLTWLNKNSIDLTSPIDPRVSKVYDVLTEGKFVFDGHTTPQHLFLNYFVYLKTPFELIKMENLSEKFSELLDREIVLENDNSYIDKPFGLVNYPIIRDIANNFCMNNDNFIKMYETDYKLYDLSW